jgi:hypothetical protein
MLLLLLMVLKGPPLLCFHHIILILQMKITNGDVMSLDESNFILETYLLIFPSKLIVQKKHYDVSENFKILGLQNYHGHSSI